MAHPLFHSDARVTSGKKQDATLNRDFVSRQITNHDVGAAPVNEPLTVKFLNSCLDFVAAHTLIATTTTKRASDALSRPVGSTGASRAARSHIALLRLASAIHLARAPGLASTAQRDDLTYRSNGHLYVKSTLARKSKAGWRENDLQYDLSNSNDNNSGGRESKCEKSILILILAVQTEARALMLKNCPNICSSLYSHLRSSLSAIQPSSHLDNEPSQPTNQRETLYEQHHLKRF